MERGIAVCKDGASFKKIGKRIRFVSASLQMLVRNFFVNFVHVNSFRMLDFCIEDWL